MRVTNVGVLIGLKSEAQELERLGETRSAEGAITVVLPEPDRQLDLLARLFASVDDGGRVYEPYVRMSASVWRRGISAIVAPYVGPPLPDDPDEEERALESYRVQRRDLEEVFSGMLGRQDLGPRWAAENWAPLIGALESRGIEQGREQLMALPFIFEFTERLRVELETGAPGSL